MKYSTLKKNIFVMLIALGIFLTCVTVSAFKSFAPNCPDGGPEPTPTVVMKCKYKRIHGRKVMVCKPKKVKVKVVEKEYQAPGICPTMPPAIELTAMTPTPTSTVDAYPEPEPYPYP